MATTKTVDQPIPTDQQPVTDLATLREQKRQIDEQIKALKAAEPQRDRLTTENARTVNRAWAGSLAAALKRRIRAGQSRAEATAAILEQCRSTLDGVATESD